MTGFFEEAPGVKSSTRLNIFILLLTGVVQVSAVVGCGLYQFVHSGGAAVSLMGVCGAAGTLFSAVIVPCLIWKNIQKPNEETK